MKKLILISSLLLSTTAFAGNNILPLRPGITNNNIMFGAAVIQVEKAPIKVEKPKKGKPTNKLESSDEFPLVDGYFEGPLPEVIFTGELEGGDGEGSGGDDIVEVGLFPEPVCACIGNIHIDPIRPDDQGATE
jgi:hypothetical protein